MEFSRTFRAWTDITFIALHVLQHFEILQKNAVLQVRTLEKYKGTTEACSNILNSQGPGAVLSTLPPPPGSLLVNTLTSSLLPPTGVVESRATALGDSWRLPWCST